MAVLSIQSHVVYGYAGNTAAVFPLQRLGREVWAINTVEFSNHTGHGSWTGKVLGAELASDLVRGLEDRGVLGRCEAVLTGYLGDASMGQAIVDTVKKVRSLQQSSPDKSGRRVIYCCDPVMGDTGRGFYVKPDIPGIFKNDLLPLADIVCPNQFELEALTGIDTSTMENAVKAINILHDKGPSIVLVTSFLEAEGEIAMLASAREPLPSAQPCREGKAAGANGKNALYKITTPKLPLGDNIAGTGDLTTSVFLSLYLETGNLKKTLELCASSVYGILEISYNKCINERIDMPMELKIIDAQSELSSPSHNFKAVTVEI